MLRKAKKIISIACILTFVLPIISYSIDKEEFLEFLVESSYPEASTKNNNSEKDKDKEDKTANKEEDYIKVHIGEENVPTLKNNTSDNKENISVASSEYKNDIRLTKEDPTMLIYHSHAGETYSDSPEGNYHSQNNRDKSVLEVGTLLTEQLSQKGWGVAHSTKYHDYPDFTKSYASSLETVKSMLNNHKNINIAIDLHRDGRDLKTDADMQKENERMSTTYNGEKVAKFFFVVGMKNPNLDEVKSLAEDITKFAKSKYPELVLPVVEHKYGKFNQYMTENHMLIEIGSNGTSSDEAKASVKYVAEILDEYFKQNR
ncbi:stage II sporulation protein P [Romboutsia ilealis]|uniref:stage II sporulation protein P n=1 Tax=Romboutsia ilealis TaxID=1115758 RepID=UPI00267648AF|nr:stage II sporulation protein P [Romboutsia ilealis]